MLIQYTFKDIFNEVKKFKKELIWANMIAIIAVCISIPVPLLMPLLIDEVLLDKPGFLVGFVDFIFGDDNKAYVYVFVVLVIVLILRALFFSLNYIQTKLFTIISKNVTFKIRKDLIRHLSKASLDSFELIGSGNIASMMLVDVDTVDDFLGSMISRLIISVLTIIGVGVVLLLIHWQLALFIMLLNPFVILITTKIARRVSALKKKENISYEFFTGVLNETLDLYLQIKSANKIDHFFGKVRSNANDLRKNAIQFTYKSDAANRFSFLVFLSGFELFRAASILVVAYSDLTIGLMLAIFGYLWVMMAPIQEVLNIQYAYHNAKAALQRINTLFAMKSEPVYSQSVDPFRDNFTNSIEIKDLSFAYGDGKEVLKNIDMTMPKGSKTAIIGASGSGKTTLAQLIVGLYPPQEGEIAYDGYSIEEIGLERVRDNVFIVLQNPQLFNDTIARNLTFGEECSKEQIEYALHVAQLNNFVNSLDFGLETMIGKNGIKLSGGQRQRLSVARMVLQNPNIVILDESTSALDVHTESRLFEALEAYLQQKTTIIIAHRLSTIRKADYIYVLDHGKVVEEGKTETLMNLEGLFYSYVKEKEIKG